MNEQEQDAVVGRLVRERKDARTKFALLQAEAIKLGEAFVTLGTMLKNKRSLPIVNEQGVIAQSEDYGAHHKLSVGDFQGDRIIALLKDMHATSKLVSSLTDQLKQLGVGD